MSVLPNASCGRRPRSLPLTGVPSYRVVQRLAWRVSLDARVQIETNRYSVPWGLAGQTVTLRIQEDSLEVTWRDRVVARHHLHPGRHQEVVDPSHLEGLFRRTYPAQETEGVVRSLDDYAKVAGGEAW